MQYGDARPTTGPEAGPEFRPKKKNLDLRALLTAAGIVSQLTSFRARLSGTRHSITKLCGDKAIDLSSAWTKPSMPARRPTITHAATTTDICVYMRIASMPCPVHPQARPPQSLTKAPSRVHFPRPSTSGVLIYGPKCLGGKSLLQRARAFSSSLPSLVRPPCLGTG